MQGRVHHRCGAAVEHTHQSNRTRSQCLDNSFEITDIRFERNVLGLTLGQACSATVMSDHRYELALGAAGSSRHGRFTLYGSGLFVYGRKGNDRWNITRPRR